MFGAEDLLGGLDVEEVVLLVDPLDVDAGANRQLEMLGDRLQEGGELFAVGVLDVEAVGGGEADRDRVQVEDADRVARKRRRDEAGLIRPGGERRPDDVALEDDEVLDARIHQRDPDPEPCRAGSDDDDIVGLDDY